MIFLFVRKKYACCTMGVYFITLATACFYALHVKLVIVSNE